MILTTPDDRFAGLPDYPFAAHRFTWEGVGIHYLDEGAGPSVVLFHGEPTWSFLYRHVIPPLVAAGYRAIAPDYPGFGKSDKPTDPDFYTYHRLVDSMLSLVDHLELEDATAVVQDWGGPIGLTVAVSRPGTLPQALDPQHRAVHRRRRSQPGLRRLARIRRRQP